MLLSSDPRTVNHAIRNLMRMFPFSLNNLPAEDALATHRRLTLQWGPRVVGNSRRIFGIFSKFVLLGAALTEFAPRAPASNLGQQSPYALNLLVTNNTPYYIGITGLPVSSKMAINPDGWGVITTDGAGRISGVEFVEIPSIGGTFTCDVVGLVSRTRAATSVRMMLRGEGSALDENSNRAPASFSLTFKAAPLEFATQSTPVVTITTNVALFSSDGSVDAAGHLIWATNLTDYLTTPPTPAQTNILSAATFTNFLEPDGTLVPIAVTTTNYATNIVAETPGLSSFSFTNDWVILQGALQGGLKIGGKSIPFKDTVASFAQPHVTNWQGAPILLDGVFYETVYSLLVGGDLNLATLDSFTAVVVQSGRTLRATATNLTGKGTVALNGKKGLATSRLTFAGIAAEKGVTLTMTATNDALITSYAVDSNAPPAVVTFTNSIGVPPIFSVSNSVSGILVVNDVVNLVTNGSYVIESHYGTADLTNPAYLTNTLSSAIKTMTITGKLYGQAFYAAGAVNLDAAYQLLPIGTQPTAVFSP